MRTDITIRRMLLADVEQVATIAARIMPFPWSQGTFLESLHAPYENWVVVNVARVVGFLITQVVLDECQIMNLGVDPAYQHQGLARGLLQQVTDQHTIQRIWLEVRVGNTAAIRFYQQCGFVQTARRKAYYPAAQGREDALVMCRYISKL